MPKDATKNVDRYKIRGGQLNEFDFHKNQAELAEQQRMPASNLIPGTPPEAKQKTAEAKKVTKDKSAAKSTKATRTTKAAKGSKSATAKKTTKANKAVKGASAKKLAAQKAAKKK